jgi:arabinofuranosyltransferase
LWIGFLVLAGALRAPLEPAAVYGGIVFALLGLVLAMRGALRLFPTEAGTGPAWPVGAAIYAVIPAAWDYASSGLDTGVGTFWLGASYAALAQVVVAGEQRASWRAWFGAAALFGLGPLIRPELALYSAAFLAPMAIIVLRQPPATSASRRSARIAALFAAAGALPFAYELVRMGYYGTLTPNTAIAKEAFRANLAQGACYFRNFFFVYAIGWPAAAAAVVYWVVRIRPLRAKKDTLRLLCATLPPLAGAIQIAYVVWMGGDYMHARMFLAPIFAMILPIAAIRFVAPSQRVRYVLDATAGVLCCWLVICATKLRVPHDNQCDVGDERGWYAEQASVRAPIALQSYRGHEFYEEGVKALVKIRGTCPSIDALDGSREPGCHLLYFNTDDFEPLSPTRATYPLATNLDPRIGAAVAYGAIGIFGYMMPDSVQVIDRHGLAEPVASHFELVTRGRPGHEKTLLSPWFVARYSAPTSPEDPSVTAARHALDCGPLEDLVASARAPLTVRQFFHNMAHAFEHTRLRIPQDPYVAEEHLCKLPELAHFTTESASDGGSLYRWQCPPGWDLSALHVAFSEKDDAIARLQATCEVSEQARGKGPPVFRSPVFGGPKDQPAPLDVRCARGSVPVGLFGATQALVEGVGFVCARPGGDPLRSAPRGRLSGKAFELSCPEGTKVVGIEGRSGDLVDQTGIVCGPR